MLKFDEYALTNDIFESIKKDTLLRRISELKKCHNKQKKKKSSTIFLKIDQVLFSIYN